MRDGKQLASLLRRGNPYVRGVCVAKMPHSYVAMDTETTGLDPFDDGIVEIAGVKVIDGVIVDRFQSFSDCGRRMSREAQAVNHITKQMLAGAPKEHDAIGAFLKFSEGLTLVAHNAKFDRGFIESVCATSGDIACTNEWFDTLKTARLFSCGRKLSDLCGAFGIENVEAHRALGDAEALHLVYQSMMAALLEVSTDARDFARYVRDGGPLTGEVIAFTGDGKTLTQHDAMAMAAEGGAVLSNSVTKKATVLVNLAGMDSAKTRKANEYASVTGVRTISETDFIRLVGGDVETTHATTKAEDAVTSDDDDAVAPPAAPVVAQEPAAQPRHRAPAPRRDSHPVRRVMLRVGAVMLALVTLLFAIAIPGSFGNGIDVGVTAIILTAAFGVAAVMLWRKSSST